MYKITSILLGTLALIGSATALTACDGVDDDASARSLAVSADDLAALPAGDQYIVDGGDDRTVHLDPSAGPLDLSKVALRLGEQGTLSLQQALLATPALHSLDADALGNASITIAPEDSDELDFRQEAAPTGCFEFPICHYGICVWVEVCVS